MRPFRVGRMNFHPSSGLKSRQEVVPGDILTSLARSDPRQSGVGPTDRDFAGRDAEGSEDSEGAPVLAARAG